MTDGFDRVVATLRGVLDGSLLVGADEVAPFANDRSGHRSTATRFAVALAGSVADVQAVCRACSAEGVAIIPRGAGTGYAGGAAAVDGAVVLSLAALDRIVSIDAESETCVVEPGVITAEVSAAVAALGLRYAPDPASSKLSTIGGNVATNAGGLCCVKYGVTRDSVLALDVVLADGTLISTGHRSIKGVTGYDLTSLMVGSEGTLGIVVGATLKLLPVPLGVVHTVAAWFPTAVQAATASVALVATRVRPSMLELVDGVHLARIDEWRGSTLSDQGQGLLLVQTDGLAAAEEASLIAAALRRSGGSVEVTAEASRAAELLAVRRWTSEEAPARPEITLNEDIAVPRGRIPALMTRIDEIRSDTGVTITVLAHIGDGNLHANLRIPHTSLDPDGSIPTEAWTAADQVVQAALDLDGTITGEHGIGRLKKQWLTTELGEAQVALQKAVKRAFDPQGILNPGAVFTS